LIPVGSANQLYSWSSATNPGMLADVQQWLNSPATDFGWIMLGNESAGQTAERFGGQNAVAPEAPPQLTVQYAPTWTWTGTADNTAWTTAANWTPGTGPPSSGAAIVLGGPDAVSGTVDLLSAAPSVSYLLFNANKTVTVTSTAAGGGLLTLDNGNFPVTVVVSGSGHTIDNTVAVMLNSDVWITTSGSSDSLSIAGDIENGTAANGIVKDGLGTLILSGSDSYTGGTSVLAGTLIAASGDALPEGTGLWVGAGASLLDAPTEILTGGGQSVTMLPDTTVASVPEPGSLVLLAAGAFVGILAARWRTRN
jgi:autotransporter-associated beta strand protein